MTLNKTAALTALTALLIPALAYAATTPAAPAAVNTNPEKAAWEALMSPVGEYAAIASYQAVIDKYGAVEPYTSILRSEQNHAQALARQLQRYGVTVPANPYLGKIPAPASLKLAAQGEADVEVANVAMYDKLFALANGDAQLTRVFNNLRSASQEMHLPAFTKAAAGNGTLSAAEMTALHTNMNTPGQGIGQGQGQGIRQGQGMQQGQGMNSADCPMHSQGQGQGRGMGGGMGGGWRR